MLKVHSKKNILYATIGVTISILLTSAPSMASVLSSLKLEELPSPFGFFPLASLGFAPFGCPSNCDDGGFSFNVPSFDFAGVTYSSVIWSVNGTIEPGSTSGIVAGIANQNLPDAVSPNNILAPLWADLDMGTDGDGAEWYAAVLTAGTDSFTVYEWNNIPLFGDSNTRFSFQTWIQNGVTTTGQSNIWFTYDRIDSVNIPMTVGVEDANGTIGHSYYYNGIGTAPTVEADLIVTAEFKSVPEPSILGFLALSTLSAATLKRKKKAE